MVVTGLGSNFLSKITVRGSNATGPSRGSYGIYVAVRVFVIVTGLGSALFLVQKSPCVALTGEGHLVAVTGSMWLLRVFVVATGLGSTFFFQKSLCVALTGQGHLVAVTGSTWLLQGLHGCYGSRFCSFYCKNRLAWL